MATFQQDITALRIKTDRVEFNLRNMIARDNLQDVTSEAQRRSVDDGMWKDWTWRSLRWPRSGTKLKWSLEGRKQSFTSMEQYYKRRTWASSRPGERQDAMEGMLTELRTAVEIVVNPVAELRSAVEMITNRMSKMQDLERDLEGTKRTVVALYARPTGSPKDPAQAPQGESSDGGTEVLGRIREALVRGEQPQASGTQRGWWHPPPDRDGLQ